MPIFRRGSTSVLFIHVPKCGGTSLEQVFKASGYQARHLDGKMGPGGMNHFRRCTPQHMHGALLQELFQIERFDTVVMLVRDPLSRFRSEYGMRHKNADPADLASVQRWTNQTLMGYLKNPYMYDNHLRPQSEFYVPGCRIHHLEAGLDQICADLNEEHDLGLVTEVPKLRDRRAESGFASGDIEIPAKARRQVRDFYLADYRLFGYPEPQV